MRKSPMRKLVCFDSDGTFRHGKTGEVPESAIRAIKELQSRNIGVVLCTGRHPIELEKMGLLKYGFDGFVCVNGQLVLDKELNDISTKTIEGNDKEVLLKLFHSMTDPMILFERNRLFQNIRASSRISLRLPLNRWFLEVISKGLRFILSTSASKAKIELFNLA